MAWAAFLPAPAARMTVAEPVTTWHGPEKRPYGAFRVMMRWDGLAGG